MKKWIMAFAALTAAGASPAWADRPCLEFGYIYSWKAITDRTLIVEDNWHKKFKLKLIGVCNNLKFHERLAFRSPGATDLTCLSPGDEVITREFGTGFERCAVTSIEAYTPDMEKADKAAAQAAKDQRSGY
jgi:hypothetical protein